MLNVNEQGAHCYRAAGASALNNNATVEHSVNAADTNSVTVNIIDNSVSVNIIDNSVSVNTLDNTLSVDVNSVSNVNVDSSLSVSNGNEINNNSTLNVHLNQKLVIPCNTVMCTSVLVNKGIKDETETM